MRTIARWGGLFAMLGGLIWSVLFVIEATSSEFELREELVDQPSIALALVIGIAFQAAGFYSLSAASSNLSVSRYAARICAVAALAQSLALFASSILGFGAAWIFGILAELVITFALVAFAISMISVRPPRPIMVIPFLMVPVYFVGWAVDPASGFLAGLDLVNLSAAIYGLLWIPFGYAIWRDLRARIGRDRPARSAA